MGASLREDKFTLLIDFAAACARSETLFVLQRTPLATVTALIARNVHPLLGGIYQSWNRRLLSCIGSRDSAIMFPGVRRPLERSSTASDAFFLTNLAGINSSSTIFAV